VDPGATVQASTCTGAEIGAGATVGPYSYLRPGARLGRNSKVGAFVEVKGSTIGEDSKVPHLSYVGDTTIGRRTNVGAATVTVNFDGKDKHRTVIGDDVRIGSDTMLVAPVTVGDGAVTGAGAVIRADVPPGALAISENTQRTIEGWAAERDRSDEQDQADDQDEGDTA
jgi:bifunctional UDP-N-acetylglucosamine pyrophosphorylase/glucosamine-1-phosphate N-acetyltransferase